MRKTIFDDVFRTICQKMPVLLIALINEVFGTDYPNNVEISQFRNEHLEIYGKIITDALVQIETTLYHIECQSEEDSLMIIRMFQYDFAIAIEEGVSNGKPYRIRFPQSCVIYLRGIGKHNLQMEVEMPDGSIFQYAPKVINIQEYSKDEIFRRKLLMFLPYYILRYEKSLSSKKGLSNDEFNALLLEYSYIYDKLESTLDEMQQSELFSDLIDLVTRINNHVIKSRRAKERMGKVMGGKILELRSEKDRRLGIREGGNLMIYSLIQDGDITLEKGAKRLNISIEQLKANMKNTGYTYPED